MLIQNSSVDPLMSLNWGPMDLELPDPATGSREVRQCMITVPCFKTLTIPILILSLLT